MAKYVKKPVVIDAERWSGNPMQWPELPEWIRQSAHVLVNSYREYPQRNTHGLPDSDVPLWVETDEGEMKASPGDMIIQGVNGEVYPCKPDVFEKTYQTADPVDELGLDLRGAFHEAYSHLVNDPQMTEAATGVKGADQLVGPDGEPVRVKVVVARAVGQVAQ